MILSHHSLAFAVAPARKGRFVNRRRPMHRRAIKWMRVNVHPSLWACALLLTVYFLTFIAAPFAAGYCISELLHIVATWPA